MRPDSIEGDVGEEIFRLEGKQNFVEHGQESDIVRIYRRGRRFFSREHVSTDGVTRRNLSDLVDHLHDARIGFHSVEPNVDDVPLALLSGMVLDRHGDSICRQLLRHR